MNFIKLFLIAVFLYFPITADWNLKHPWPNISTLNDAVVVNNKTIIAVGEDGIIVKTRNGGDYWKNEFINPHCKLNSIAFWDSLNGVICGDTNFIYSSEDGGETWSAINNITYDSCNSIENLTLLDSTDGWMTINKSILLSSKNAGGSWDSVYTFPEEVVLLKFTSKNIGIAVTIMDDPSKYFNVHMSLDGGKNWEKKLSKFKTDFNSISSIDSNSYALFGIHYYGYNIPYPHPFTITTSDCWETHDTINFDTSDYYKANYAIFNGQMLGKDSVSLINDKYQHIYGAKSDSVWKVKVTRNNLPALKGKQIKDGLGVVINESGNLVYTRNGGADWINVKNGTSNISTLTKILFINSKLGWASGDQSEAFTSQPPKGIIFKTLDGGERWHKISQTFGRSVVDIEFSDANNGWLIYGDGDVLCYLKKSVDGGLSWSSVPPIADSVKYRAIDFINKDVGFITGKKNIIKTEDGGETWIKQSINCDTNEIIIKDIKMLSLTKGWLIGEKGLLLETTDGGRNWNQVEINTINNLTSIFFLDNEYGWITAGNQLFKTSDGGINWIKLSNPEEITITKLVFVNQFQGIAINGNLTYNTNDGGGSWTREDNKSISSLFDICLSDNKTVWSSGGKNGIYNRTIENSVSINFNAKNHLTDFQHSIKINNPSKKIAVDLNLKKDEKVSIRFYTLNGKQIPTSKFSKFLKHGNHLISFSKNSFTNGVIIARIKVGNYSFSHNITIF